MYIVNTLLGEREPRYSSVFGRIRLDPEAHTLVWPNRADFDPAILHNWPEAGGALAELARSWVVPAN